MKTDPLVFGRCSVEATHRPGAVVSRRVAHEGIYGQLEILGIIHLVFPVRVEEGPLGQRRADVLPEVPATDRLVEDEGSKVCLGHAATADEVAILVRERLPRGDALERWRFLDGRRPLLRGQPGVPAHAHRAIAPWLCCNELDRVVAVDTCLLLINLGF